MTDCYPDTRWTQEGSCVNSLRDCAKPGKSCLMFFKTSFHTVFIYNFQCPTFFLLVLSFPSANTFELLLT